MPALTDPTTPYVGRRGAAAPNGGTSTSTGSSSGGATSTRPAAPTIDWVALVNQLNAPIDYGALAKIAGSRAASETGSLVAGYQGLQKSALEQAARYAAQQGQAGLASSKYLGGLDLGGAVAGDYANAAAAQRAAAAGYSGGLQQTVDETAARVQHSLEAAGSPQTALNQSAAAGNALYGLGGNLPALQLDAIGPAVAAGLRAQPAQLLGYAQTLAAGQLAKGQETAAGYADDIATARAKQGALAAKYLDTLSQRAAEAGQDRIATLLKVAALQQKSSAAAAEAGKIDVARSKLLGYVIYNDGTVPRVKGDPIPVGTVGATKPNIQTWPNGEVVQILPNGKIIQLRAPTVDAPDAHWVTGTDANGQYAYDTTTGQKIYTGGLPPSETGGAGLDTITAPDGSKWMVTQTKTGYSFSRLPGALGQPSPSSQGANRPPENFTLGGRRYAWQQDPKTKKWSAVPVTKVVPGGGSASASTIKSLQDDIKIWYSGQTGTSQGQPVIDEGSQLTWLEAVNQAAERVPRARAIRMVNAVFGTPGRIADNSVSQQKAAGNILISALTDILTDATNGDLEVPVDYYLQAAARVYGKSVKFVRSTFQQMIKAQQAGGVDFRPTGLPRTTAGIPNPLMPETVEPPVQSAPLTPGSRGLLAR